MLQKNVCKLVKKASFTYLCTFQMEKNRSLLGLTLKNMSVIFRFSNMLHKT